MTTTANVVSLPDGSTVKVTNLLSVPTNGNKRRFNKKLWLSNVKSGQYVTVGLSLAPASMSGYQVCSSSSPGCRKACLVNSGYAWIFDSINRARIAKTRLFFEDREIFLRKLVREILHWQRKAKQQGKRLAVRLNVFSDLQWERLAPELFTTFKDVQFYDYTKHFKRMLRWCAGSLPGNYHLTFSRSETNHAEALDVLRAGGNVAIVFESKSLRDSLVGEAWNGYTVIDGDETDLRFLDGNNVVVGLYAKGVMGRADTSGFVVRLSLPLIDGGQECNAD